MTPSDGRLFPVTLLTIVAETVLEEELTRRVMGLGATGYTVTASRGRGSKGMRTGDIPGEGVRIEVLAGEDAARSILDMLASEYFPHYAVAAWLTDVQVVRGEKYA
ncbi:MAG TPA: hypothetical protein VK858_13510 [Longimicrobiales bacterium]|nr:hypothetical protein [Longimicrobiales bacterium]